MLYFFLIDNFIDYVDIDRMPFTSGKESKKKSQNWTLNNPICKTNSKEMKIHVSKQISEEKSYKNKKTLISGKSGIQCIEQHTYTVKKKLK